MGRLGENKRQKYCDYNLIPKIKNAKIKNGGIKNSEL